MNLGEKIRALREKAGMSQLDLAPRLRIRQNRPSRYERGQHQPRPDMLKNISEACDVPIGALFDKTTETRVSESETPYEDDRSATKADVKRIETQLAELRKIFKRKGTFQGGRK
jgi:transcriptional regulator with XRE-family HTH domain